MSIGIIVDMTSAAEVRNGNIFISDEMGKNAGKPGAKHMTRDEFDKMKSAVSNAVTGILIALPLLLGIGAFFEGGGLQLLKKLPEFFKSLPEKLSAGAKNFASGVEEFGSQVVQFAKCNPEEMRQRISNGVQSACETLASRGVREILRNALRIVENLSTMSQAGVRTQQSVLALELGDLQKELAGDRTNMQEVQGNMELMQSAMTLFKAAFSQMQESSLSVQTAVIGILKQTNDTATMAAHNTASV